MEVSGWRYEWRGAGERLTHAWSTSCSARHGPIQKEAGQRMCGGLTPMSNDNQNKRGGKPLGQQGKRWTRWVTRGTVVPGRSSAVGLTPHRKGPVYCPPQGDLHQLSNGAGSRGGRERGREDR